MVGWLVGWLVGWFVGWLVVGCLGSGCVVVFSGLLLRFSVATITLRASPAWLVAILFGIRGGGGWTEVPYRRHPLPTFPIPRCHTCFRPLPPVRDLGLGCRTTASVPRPTRRHPQGQPRSRRGARRHPRCRRGARRHPRHRRNGGWHRRHLLPNGLGTAVGSEGTRPLIPSDGAVGRVGLGRVGSVGTVVSGRVG